MNWKSKLGLGIIAADCYSKLNDDHKENYDEVEDEPTHVVEDIVEGAVVLSLLSDLFSSSSSSSSSSDNSSFDGFGGGDFSGGGSDGEF